MSASAQLRVPNRLHQSQCWEAGPNPISWRLHRSRDPRGCRSEVLIVGDGGLDQLVQFGASKAAPPGGIRPGGAAGRIRGTPFVGYRGDSRRIQRCVRDTTERSHAESNKPLRNIYLPARAATGSRRDAFTAGVMLKTSPVTNAQQNAMKIGQSW